jgi:hypothetical protein
MDVANLGVAAGFNLEGVTILVQNSKRLFPYGYPYAVVQNIQALISSYS